MMRKYYADLHVHIGRAGERPVKVTASSQLTLSNLILWGARRKGLDVVGIVDAASPLVIQELETMLESGALLPAADGGLASGSGLLLLLGAEVETVEGAHFLSYLPDLTAMKEFRVFLKSRVSNLNLSTPKARVAAKELLRATVELDGIFCPAHAFTPHKGAYGCWIERLAVGLGDDVGKVEALELGLSADSKMAHMISETDAFCFLSNSDAHSLASLGREYNCLLMENPSFAEVRRAVRGEKGRQVLANYGMHPMLGKYHRSFCPRCSAIATGEAPVTACDRCGNRKMVLGVWDRICQIRDRVENPKSSGAVPYHYRVPLAMLPGVGLRTVEKLVEHFENEIHVIENADLDEIKQVAGAETATVIGRMRRGKLSFVPGGGGKYGKVQKD